MHKGLLLGVSLELKGKNMPDFGIIMSEENLKDLQWEKFKNEVMIIAKQEVRKQVAYRSIQKDYKVSDEELEVEAEQIAEKFIEINDTERTIFVPQIYLIFDDFLHLTRRLNDLSREFEVE